MVDFARLLCFRGLRCHTKCGWRGYRFSRSLFGRRKRRLRIILIILFFMVIAGMTVRHMVLRAGLGQSGAQEDNILESN
jgi:ABC-type lipoprotein release transport system permease subunit